MRGTQAVPVPPPPLPSCITPAIFRDCFGACTGVVTDAAPGPVCGWTWFQPFPEVGGSVVFAPGSMSFETTADDQFPGAIKPLQAPLSSVKNVTCQFSFTEYATPPNFLTTYNLMITNQEKTEAISLGLFGDNSAIIQAGNIDVISNFVGTWTPTQGPHVVHFSISAEGVPLLFIDQVLIPLVFSGTAGTFASELPPNTAGFFIGPGDPAPASSPVRNLFLTTGILGPETKFCCP